MTSMALVMSAALVAQSWAPSRAAFREEEHNNPEAGGGMQ